MCKNSRNQLISSGYNRRSARAEHTLRGAHSAFRTRGTEAVIGAHSLPSSRKL